MTVFVFGEAMLEFHSRGGAAGLRYGGDTLNTAIHLARLGQKVAYVTAVGTDPISDALVAAWAAEGIDTQFILRHPTLSPGIYAIAVDASGERSFLYWRDRSAAKEMFALPGMTAAIAAAGAASLLYFSLISLAILPVEGRGQLLGLAMANKRAGGRVAYDSNFRANLWASNAEAMAVSNQAIAAACVGLPTNVDEVMLRGYHIPDAGIPALWVAAGCTEVVLKAGESGCHLAVGTPTSRPFAAQKIDPVDTSGAGDAFNAAYLSARLDGQAPDSAIQKGQLLARWVISRTGAVPRIDSMAPYREDARVTAPGS